MHSLLVRQLGKAFNTAAPPDGAVLSLIAQVDAAYREHDAHAKLIEQALQVVSDELNQRNRDLVLQLREREQIELELTHALKLEAVGQLASGIAHEINTPIQYVGDSVSYVRDAMGDVVSLLNWHREALVAAMTGAAMATEQQLRDEEERCDITYALEQIPLALKRTLEGVDHVATLVRALREFAHPDSSEMVSADLNAALRTAVHVAAGETRRVADVHFDLGDIPLVPCHLGEINQVMLNLLVNASHAIGDANRGRGQITVRSRAIDGAVELSVEDNGSGIPAGIRERIFDPFFTTKDVGRGTGQGLAIARNIVQAKHGGQLTFETREGEGTTFFVRLPLDIAAPGREEAFAA